MERNKRNKYIRDGVLMVIGALLCAAATKMIFDPAGLVTGGVSGLSIVLRSVTRGAVPLWLSNLVLNVPVLLYAARVRGWRRCLRTVAVWLLITGFLLILPEDLHLTDSMLLAAIYGAIFFGLSTALLLMADATSGGSDMLADALHHSVLRSVSIGRLIQVIDGAVVLLGALVFGVEATLYAIIAVVIMGYVTDLVLGRGRSAQMALIISGESGKISQEIMDTMDRGVTGLYGRGLYTQEDKTILMCICSKRDIVRLKDIVKKYDERAFFLVSNVREAMGEGFLEDWEPVE